MIPDKPISFYHAGFVKFFNQGLKSSFPDSPVVVDKLPYRPIVNLLFAAGFTIALKYRCAAGAMPRRSSFPGDWHA